MRLVHLASFNSTNIGNGALILGTERVLKEDLGIGLEFIHEPWDDYTFGFKKFDSDFVDLVNCESDALLVNGAVSFYGRPYLTNTGFRFDLPLHLIKAVKKPIVFYGLSYRVWPGQKYHHLGKLKQTIGYLLASPKVLFGVRNDGTKKWLESVLGYRSDRIHEIPDPALYVPVKDSSHPELVRGRKNVIISLNNEDEICRFGGEFRRVAWNLLAPYMDEKKLINVWRYMPRWDSRRRAFLKNLANVVEKLVKKWDVNIILCPHYFDDYVAMGEFLTFFSGGLASIRIPHQAMVSSGLLRFSQTSYFYDLYAKVDLALSMRVHSVSPSIGLGTPVVPLVSQSRISDFLANIGLAEIGVDIFGDNVADKIWVLADSFLADGQKIRAKLKAAVVAMREQTHRYNKKLFAILTS